MYPIISVIVPCYNQAQYLDECLQSVLDQTYQDWECIIVNDGSPDNTEEIAKKWLERDQRFRYIWKENGGLSSARNFGVEKAKGEWILTLDSDDYISNDYLQLAQKKFSDESIKVIYCEAQKFGIINEKWTLPDFSLLNLAEQNVIFCSAFFKKDDWKIVGGYDENLKVGLEDWDFWISILKSGGNVAKIDSICFYYRTKEYSMLSNLVISGTTAALIYIEKKHLDFFHKQLGSITQIYHTNCQNEKIIDVIVKKRKVSRLVNQVYSFFESRFPEEK